MAPIPVDVGPAGVSNERAVQKQMAASLALGCGEQFCGTDARRELHAVGTQNDADWNCPRHYGYDSHRSDPVCDGFRRGTSDSSLARWRGNRGDWGGGVSIVEGGLKTSSPQDFPAGEGEKCSQVCRIMITKSA